MLLRVLTRRLRSPLGPFSIVQCRLRPGFAVRQAVRSVNMAHPKVVFADPRAEPRTSNKHVSVNAEGIELVDLGFTEEPLGVTAEQGYGFLRIEFGDAIGPDKRYKIVRKLGGA